MKTDFILWLKFNLEELDNLKYFFCECVKNKWIQHQQKYLMYHSWLSSRNDNFLFKIFWQRKDVMSFIWEEQMINSVNETSLYFLFSHKE
jgi:hypothetical protein